MVRLQETRQKEDMFRKQVSDPVHNVCRGSMLNEVVLEYITDRVSASHRCIYVGVILTAECTANLCPVLVSHAVLHSLEHWAMVHFVSVELLCNMHSITAMQCLRFPILALSSTHPTTPVSTLQTAVLEDQFTLPDGTVTLAEPRPNAYIPQSDTELPLPKPYGSQAPFKPSQPGATMRHIRKPVPKPIDI